MKVSTHKVARVPLSFSVGLGRARQTAVNRRPAPGGRKSQRGV